MDVRQGVRAFRNMNLDNVSGRNSEQEEGI